MRWKGVNHGWTRIRTGSGEIQRNDTNFTNYHEWRGLIRENSCNWCRLPGVRAVPDAATSVVNQALRRTMPCGLSCVAAPGDGRTPVLWIFSALLCTLCVSTLRSRSRPAMLSCRNAGETPALPGHAPGRSAADSFGQTQSRPFQRWRASSLCEASGVGSPLSSCRSSPTE
jgi:hypothetical protein